MQGGPSSALAASSLQLGRFYWIASLEGVLEWLAHPRLPVFMRRKGQASSWQGVHE
jgi:hypothetical protein